MKEYEEDLNVNEEFIHLCQQQLNLLIHTFFVQEMVIYLTSNNSDESKLIPIFIYPEDSHNSPFNLSLPSSINQDFESGVNDSFFSHTLVNYPSQLILPLIYQDLVLGLLMIKRDTASWEEREILQLKSIAQTITFARLLDKKQQLSQTKLTQIQQLRSIESDYINDFLHQIKNPLTAIRTFAKLLLKRLIPDDKNYGFVENIIRETDRLRELINDFSQEWHTPNKDEIILLNNHQSSFFLPETIEELKPLNIMDIIHPLMNTIKAIATEKNILIIMEIPDNLPQILSNEKALIEILNNLLENAVKYTPSQGKILLEIIVDDTFLVVNINDNGYGIPEKDQPYIFERHFRGVQSQGDISGTGLGLSIVKELCDKIGIKINLISPYYWTKKQAYQGTQFSLTIPLYYHQEKSYKVET